MKVQGTTLELSVEKDSMRAVKNTNMFDENNPCLGVMPRLIGQKKLFIKGNPSCSEGRVYVEGVVNKQGFLIRARIVKGICDVLDVKALKLLSSAKYEPAICNKDTLEVRIVIPVLIIK